MRRILAALACVAAIALSVGPAAAIQMHTIEVPWIRNGITNGIRNTDSTFAIRTSAFVAASTAQPIDTTEWIPIWEKMAWPGGSFGGAATDTISARCVFTVAPDPLNTLGITVAVDTITTTIQASINGNEPVAVTSTFTGNLETSSNNALYKIVNVGQTGAVPGTAPTTLQLLPYAYIRFIVAGDHVGVFRAYWRFPGADVYDPYKRIP